MDIRLIVCAIDGSDPARKALDLACDLAKSKRAKLVVLHVRRPRVSASVPDELESFAIAESMAASGGGAATAVAEMIAREGETTAREAGVSDVEGLVMDGDPTRQIVSLARQRGADLIVVGSRGRGEVAGLLLGSVSHKLAQIAPCSCIIVR
jgi:nucleotide-binding universal stress UspA family protein